MIYKTKHDLAKDLGCYRQKITAMIKRDEVKVIYNNKGQKLGYVHIINHIKYLLG